MVDGGMNGRAESSRERGFPLGNTLLRGPATFAS